MADADTSDVVGVAASVVEAGAEVEAGADAEEAGVLAGALAPERVTPTEAQSWAAKALVSTILTFSMGS